MWKLSCVNMERLPNGKEEETGTAPNQEATTVNFYTYCYLRKDLTPYYIGKGSNDRAWKSHDNVGKPSDPNRIMIMKSNVDETTAFYIERFWISVFGRKDLGTGCLRNKTDGGDGPSGMIVSEATKEKMRQAKVGKKQSPETVAKRFAAKKKFKHTAESIEKMRASKTGKKKSVPVSDATKRLLSDKMKAIWANRKVEASSINNDVKVVETTVA